MADGKIVYGESGQSAFSFSKIPICVGTHKKEMETNLELCDKKTDFSVTFY